MSMVIELLDEEADVLRSILFSTLSELREEIYRTETFEYKDDLKIQQRLLKSLLEKLESAQEASV